MFPLSANHISFIYLVVLNDWQDATRIPFPGWAPREIQEVRESLDGLWL